MPCNQGFERSPNPFTYECVVSTKCVSSWTAGECGAPGAGSGGAVSGAIPSFGGTCTGEEIGMGCYGACPQGYEPDMNSNPKGTRCARIGLNPPADTDKDGIPNDQDPDIDGDGIPNDQDPDIDGDGIPNDQDTDANGDGIPDKDQDTIIPPTTTTTTTTTTNDTSDLYNRALNTQYLGDVFYKDPGTTKTTPTPKKPTTTNPNLLLAVGLVATFMFLNRR